MKISHQFNVTLILALLLAGLLGPSQSSVSARFEQRPGMAEMAPLGTAFTYQGHLKQNGTPVNGNCDFQFKLWDAASGGSQVGSTLEMPLAVTAGLFTASLDFGGVAFSGQARWLEVSVRCPAGGGSFASLGLQPLTPAPYSLYSQNADLLDGMHGAFYQDASNLNAGTLNNAYFSASSDLDAEGYLDNAAGNLAQNNGMLQSTLNADLLDGMHASNLQARVSGNCAVGSAIRAIYTNGTVECGQFPAFSRTPVDTAGDVGYGTSIAIGSDGLGLISYNDNTNLDLKVAHCSDLACNRATITILDSASSGSYTSIAIGGDGLGLISYYENNNGDLKVVHCTNTACSTFNIYTLDNVGNVGGYTDIAIGSDGLGLISYGDVTNGDLKVAHCANAACSSATVNTLDSAGNVGKYTSITLDNDGLGLISYFDDTSDDLKVAHCLNAACSTFNAYTLDSAGFVGEYTSIVTGSDGLGLISYYDFTNGNLKVAHCANAVCSTFNTYTLDSIGSVGYYTSITLGSDGFGLISYYDYTNGHLKVAHCNNIACSDASIYILDSATYVGVGTSIAIGGDGLGLISYYDEINRDLLVAHCDDVWCKP